MPHFTLSTVSILEHFLDKQVLAFLFFLRLQHFLLNHPQRNIRLHGDDILLRNLQKYLKKHLARYEQPRKIIILDELPKTRLGKISYKELENYEEEDK